MSVALAVGCKDKAPEVPVDRTANDSPQKAKARAIEDGRRYYLVMCAGCHGKLGDGQTRVAELMPVGDLRSPGLHRRLTDAGLRAVIRKGKGKMPGFESGLDDKQLAALAAYVRTLRASE